MARKNLSVDGAALTGESMLVTLSAAILGLRHLRWLAPLSLVDIVVISGGAIAPLLVNGTTKQRAHEIAAK